MASPDWQEWLKQAEHLLFKEKKLAEASSLIERVLQVHPNCAPALQVLGLALSESGRAHEAIAQLKKAVALQPDLPRAHSALGLSYSHLGDLDRALHHVNTCIYLQPEYPFAHLIRAFIWLRQGKFNPGWIELEWRYVCGMVSRVKVPRPRWDGAPLEGRSILIDTEQGSGDVIQFIRLLPMLKSQGAKIVLVVTQPQVHALIRPLPYYDQWLAVGETGPITFDLYCPLLSLPGLLGIDESNIPKTVPYLFSEPHRAARWRPRVEALPGFKVGICWQGNPAHGGDRFRSIPLEQFAALAEVPGVTLVSLQKGHGVEQIEASCDRIALQVFDDMDRQSVFLDTAAVMEHLDLVITVDTSIAHLAGAMGRPVWVLLSTASDWRWLDGRADSPWYPTMRLFRQKSLGDWAEVLREVADALKTESGRKRSA
jgi:ADP-heptose:LPS heptosyltransferase